MYRLVLLCMLPNRGGSDYTTASQDSIHQAFLEDIRLVINKWQCISSKSCHTGACTSSIFSAVQLLDLEDNSISDWQEVMHVSHLPCLKHLWLGGNQLQCIDLRPGVPCTPTVASSIRHQLGFETVYCAPVHGAHCHTRRFALFAIW